MSSIQWKAHLCSPFQSFQEIYQIPPTFQTISSSQQNHCLLVHPKYSDCDSTEHRLHGPDCKMLVPASHTSVVLHQYPLSSRHTAGPFYKILLIFSNQGVQLKSCPFEQSIIFLWNSYGHRWLQLPTLWQMYCLGIKVEWSYKLLAFKTDIGCHHDRQQQEPHLIEVDSNIHDFVYFLIKIGILWRVASRLKGGFLSINSFSFTTRSSRMFSSSLGLNPSLPM